MRIRRRPLIAAILGVGALILSVLAVPGAAAAPSQKQFAMDVQPPCVPVGTAGVPMSVILTNETSGQQLGSVDVLAPAGFVLAGPATSTVGTATIDADGRTIHVRQLSLGFNRSATVSFTATTPAAGSTAPNTYHWTAIGKQSNDFNGPPGNEVFLNAAHSFLDTFVGTCRTVFSIGAGVQPNTTRVAEDIRGGLFSSGNPVTVEVRNGFNQLVVNARPQLTLQIVDDFSCSTPPCSAQFIAGSPVTATAVAGVARFGDGNGPLPALAIDRPGLNYTVQATGFGITSPEESAAFDVVNEGQVCTGPGCKRTASKGTGTGKVDVTLEAPNSVNGNVLILALDVEALTCADYAPLTGTPVVTFEVSGPSYRLVTIVVPAGLAIRPASQDRVCYSSDTASFVDRGGVTRAAGQAGLLEDCKNRLDLTIAFNPCQFTTVVDKDTGAHIVTFAAPPGSTRGRT